MPSPEEIRNAQLGLPAGLTTPQLVERYGSHYADSFAAIPPGVFTPGFQETICTVSGHNLVCDVSENVVDIHVAPDANDGEKSDPTFKFLATISIMPKYADLVLAFAFRNRDPRSATPDHRHPDIHPSCLARRSLDYFRGQGFRVEKMETEWNKSVMQGDNWQQYRDYLAQNEKWWRGPRPKDQYRAAFATMSGQLAVRLGFSELWRHHETPEGEMVTSLFAKPDGITAGGLALMCAPPDLDLRRATTIPAASAEATNPRRGNL